METAELEFTDHDVFAGCNLCDLPSTPTMTGSMESFLDEMLRSTQTCTHTHTCNPPGPDNTHTHTCYHTHTQLFATGEEDSSADKSETTRNGKKRPLGNREAVRKYREKKKAHTAYLEDQVNHLRALNQQLVKRLQGQVSLEAEVVRLRLLLSEFRGRIDAEVNNFPAQNKCPSGAANPAKTATGECDVQPLSGGFCLNTVSIPCVKDVPCFHTAGATTAVATSSLPLPPTTPNLDPLKWNSSSNGTPCAGLSDSTDMPFTS